MRFLLASLYRREYRAMIAAEGIPLDVAPDPVVRCPRCDVLYVADLAPDADPWDLEAAEWQAVVRLDGECPGHAHAFGVADT
jgi:hypothetical protein